MCQLQTPFNAKNLTGICNQILKGKYKPLPEHYGKHIPYLLELLLQQDPKKRPSIYSILKYAPINKRIKRLLCADTYKEEFSHALLHGQNVFEELAKIQRIKK
jgi:hypothetical protein